MRCLTKLGFDGLTSNRLPVLTIASAEPMEPEVAGLSGAAPVSPRGVRGGDVSRGRRNGGINCSSPGGVCTRLRGVELSRLSPKAAAEGGSVKEAELRGERSEPSEGDRDGAPGGLSFETDSGCPFHK